MNHQLLQAPTTHLAGCISQDILIFLSLETSSDYKMFPKNYRKLFITNPTVDSFLEMHRAQQ